MYELADGLSQGLFRVYADESGDVDQGEEDISQFILHPLRVFCVQGLAKLADLFLYLVDDLIDALPVKADTGSLVLNTVGLQQGG